MIQIRFLTILAGMMVVIFMGLVVNTVHAQTSCIDYWTPGMSGCEGKIEPEPEPEPEALPEIVVPAPAAPAEKAEVEITGMSKEKTLEMKIDEFMADYGKPPREFVAFNLEPSVENAVKWVQKFHDMMDRNRALTVAWQQAQRIYEQAQETGADLPALDNPLPEVPDYGIALAPEMNSMMAGGFGGADFMNVAGFGHQSGFGGTSPAATGTSPLSVQQASYQGQVDPFAVSTLTSKSLGGPAPEDVMRISYYFSAECPYCQRFEPEFKQILSEMGDQVEVTCVDMTPSGQTAMNITGKLDCAWRPIMPNEMETYGVNSTPTLIIDRAGDGPLERVSGYVDSDSLRRHLLQGNGGL